MLVLVLVSEIAGLGLGLLVLVLDLSVLVLVSRCVVLDGLVLTTTLTTIPQPQKTTLYMKWGENLNSI